MIWGYPHDNGDPNKKAKYIGIQPARLVFASQKLANRPGRIQKWQNWSVSGWLSNSKAIKLNMNVYYIIYIYIYHFILYYTNSILYIERYIILYHITIESRGVLPRVSHSVGWEFELSKIALNSLILAFYALLEILEIPWASENRRPLPVINGLLNLGYHSRNGARVMLSNQ